MNANNQILAFIDNDILPLTTKLLNVNTRLETVKSNLSEILTEYGFIMSFENTLKKLEGDERIFNIFTSIRPACVKFKIATEQFKYDQDTFLTKFYKLTPGLLAQQSSNLIKLEELINNTSLIEINKFYNQLSQLQHQLRSIEHNFTSFYEFYKSGTVEKLLNKCEKTILYYYKSANMH